MLSLYRHWSSYERNTNTPKSINLYTIFIFMYTVVHIVKSGEFITIFHASYLFYKIVSIPFYFSFSHIYIFFCSRIYAIMKASSGWHCCKCYVLCADDAVASIFEWYEKNEIKNWNIEQQDSNEMKMMIYVWMRQNNNKMLHCSATHRHINCIRFFRFQAHTILKSLTRIQQHSVADRCSVMLCIFIYPFPYYTCSFGEQHHRVYFFE